MDGYYFIFAVQGGSIGQTEQSRFSPHLYYKTGKFKLFPKMAGQMPAGYGSKSRRDIGMNYVFGGQKSDIRTNFL
jgi:hypothetical protein